MATVRPFRALRPAPRWVEEVAAPPYDVIETEEARERVKGHPYSFLRVSRAEVDFDPSTDPHDPRVYRRALENLNAFIRDGVLVQDPEPRLYLYRLDMDGHVQTGVYGCVSAAEYEAGVVRKHENTRVDKETDRAEHIEALGAHTGPVFLMSRRNEAVQRLAAGVVSEAPLYRFVHDYGVEHTFWSVGDPERLRAFREAFASVDILYIADGHHRAAAAARVAKARRAADPRATGGEEYNFFPAVVFPDDEMRILNYNRVVLDLNGLGEEEFIGAVRRRFEVQPAGGPFQPGRRAEFGMCLRGRWYALTDRPGAADPNDPIACLDVSRLQDGLLDPVLGIRDPRTDQRIRFVGGIRGLGELERLVAAGSAVAFSLYATGIDQLMAVADAGRVMPPKSTWFEPKLRSGLALHRLD